MAPVGLFPERRYSRLDLGHAGAGLVAGGLGRRRELPEAALGRTQGAFQPLVRALQGDEDADAVLGHGEMSGKLEG